MDATLLPVRGLSRRAALRLSALLTPFTIATMDEPAVMAQEATPEATPAASSASPETQRDVRRGD